MSKPTLLQVIHSVFAALIGVQSKENRERDFQHGSTGMFVVTGFIVTLLFVFILILIVSTVLG